MLPCLMGCQRTHTYAKCRDALVKFQVEFFCWWRAPIFFFDFPIFRATQTSNHNFVHCLGHNFTRTQTPFSTMFSVLLHSKKKIQKNPLIFQYLDERNFLEYFVDRHTQRECVIPCMRYSIFSSQ